MTTPITAPISGTVIPLSEVPDPVFAEEIVGPGAAIDPGEAASLTAVAPVAGTLSSLKPHAFVVSTADGRGILVHLGIDTVELSGAGFELHAEQGAEVTAGQTLITWDTAAAREAGKSLVVPVIVLEAEAGDLKVTPAVEVAAGDGLIELA